MSYEGFKPASVTSEESGKSQTPASYVEKIRSFETPIAIMLTQEFTPEEQREIDNRIFNDVEPGSLQFIMEKSDADEILGKVRSMLAAPVAERADIAKEIIGVIDNLAG